MDTEELKFEVPPQIKNGTTLVPFRPLFEALGMDVEWNSGQQLVTGKNNDTTISLVIGEKRGTVNSQTYTLNEAATIVNGYTLVPLRFIGEATGAFVAWDPYNREISIVTTKFMEENNISREELDAAIKEYLAIMAEEEKKKQPPTPVPKNPDPPVNLGNLAGMYAGFRSDVGGYECGGMCWDIYTFLPNNKVFVGAPPNGGPETINCSTDGCLSYTISNGQLKLSDGKTLPIKKSSNGSLVINDVTLSAVHSVPQGTTLQNKYKYISYTGLIGVTGASSSKTTHLTLNSDGTFELSGVTIGNVGGGMSPSTDATIIGDTQTGTYKIENNTITMTGSDGTVTKSLFFMHDQDPTDIQIGEINYYVD